MVARIFDFCQIRNLLDTKELLKWFLSDFPYKTEELLLTDSENPAVLGEDCDFAGMVNDFRMLSLLMDKDSGLLRIKNACKDEIPFKECNKSKFSELDKSRFTALFFPLRTFGEKKEPSPAWGLVVKSDGGKTFFFNAVTQKWSSSWDYKNNGSSCRLAETLAEKLLETGEAEYICTAAKEWIVTGDVDENGRVVKVGLGNKLKLNTKRKFVIPDGNSSEVSYADRKRLKGIYSADSLEKVMNLVTNHGVKPLPTGDFSEKTGELHILVGESIAPQIASILLAKPEKVVLWCSESGEKSQLPAKCIVEIIKLCAGNAALKFKLPDFEENELHSDSMAKAEEKLIEYFKKNSCGSKNILFNITSSNRIMGFAVQTVARMYSDNVKLIYRDIDSREREKGENSEKYFFHILQYSSFPPAYGEICAETGSLINLEQLRNGNLKSKEEKISEENILELSERYYEKLVKMEE